MNANHRICKSVRNERKGAQILLNERERDCCFLAMNAIVCAEKIRFTKLLLFAYLLKYTYNKFLFFIFSEYIMSF